MRVIKVSKDDWRDLAERAHLIVFGEKMVANEDRIDFTLVADDGTPAQGLIGYITCREFDAKSLYWQYGGAFPGTKKTSMSYVAYLKCLRWAEGNYDRVMTLVENKNYVMLKMHLKAGFLIAGFRQHKGLGMVELVKEFR